jgi:hypothetical protein
MFIGHFGVAMAAKKVAPRPSLGTLVLAAQLADGVWPIFLLLGWETVTIAPSITPVTPLDFTSYPYTHSLLADAMWAALRRAGARRSRAASARARARRARTRRCGRGAAPSSRRKALPGRTGSIAIVSPSRSRHER